MLHNNCCQLGNDLVTSLDFFMAYLRPIFITILTTDLRCIRWDVTTPPLIATILLYFCILLNYMTSLNFIYKSIGNSPSLILKDYVRRLTSSSLLPVIYFNALFWPVQLYLSLFCILLC